VDTSGLDEPPRPPDPPGLPDGVRIVVLGGGPAGLYFALLLRKARPDCEVTVLERNGPDDTFGWGVVFSDQTLGNLEAADPTTYGRITTGFARWDEIDVHIGDAVVTSRGHGFSGIGRARLLRILQERAAELGVEIRYRTELAHLAELDAHGLGDATLVVAADGVGSMVRRTLADAFEPELDLRANRYIWFGTTVPFDAFTFYFVETPHGVFQAHCYRFQPDLSTFIVECDEASWRAAGFDALDMDGAIRACETLFGRWLGGHRLLSNASHKQAEPWSRFLVVRNARWFSWAPLYPDRKAVPVVLVGDAAHTAHFSIGSGTKLAMEDAIALASRVAAALPTPASLGGDRADAVLPLDRALRDYQEDRRTEALRLQNAARNSMEWFENVRRYIHLEPEQFAYSLLTRSQRVSHENLRLRDRPYLEGVERWFAGRAGGEPGDRPPPPMFTPFRLRGMTVANRVVVSPMDMYSAVDGTPNEFHLVHLGARALGGAGLVMTEMTCVSAEGRISLGCTGMYAPEHVAAWRRITAFVHEWSEARVCLQLGHSGRKGSTRKMWEGMDEPLAEGGWSVMGPSPLPWSPANPTPIPMNRADMEAVTEEFVRAAEMAIVADFDMLELHCAHGYLLSSFLTPISNQRTDRYGGSLRNRLRFPLEVFEAIRGVWPADRPISVRISATDWAEHGITPTEAVAIGRAFADAGADILHVSAGQTTVEAKPVYGRMFQTPLSDRIRNEGGVPTIAVGNITEPDQVNSIIAAGRADLCALGRPHLTDPHWTLRAAAELGYAAQWWPVQYGSGKAQIERQFERLRS
jgi:anthraniloyl-CoA monooxygenase